MKMLSCSKKEAILGLRQCFFKIVIFFIHESATLHSLSALSSGERLLCNPDLSPMVYCLFFLPKQNKFLYIMSCFLQIRIFCFHSLPCQLPRIFLLETCWDTDFSGLQPSSGPRLRIPSFSFPVFFSILRGHIGGTVGPSVVSGRSWVAYFPTLYWGGNKKL